MQLVACFRYKVLGTSNLHRDWALALLQAAMTIP